MPVPRAMQVKTERRERDHQREVGVEGDRDDHGGDGDGDQFGVPGLHAEDADDAEGQDHQAADHGDPAGIPDGAALVPPEVISRQDEQRRDQGEDSHGPSHAIAKIEARDRGVVFQAEQDELLLADDLALFDEHLAAGERVVMVVDERRAASRSEAVASASKVSVGVASRRLAIRPKRIWPIRGEVNAPQNSW